MTGILTVSASKTYSINDVPRIMTAQSRGFVCDPDGYLNARQSAEINRNLKRMENTTTAEMIVVLLPNVDDDPTQFAVNLATEWGVGKGSNNNGIILLIVMNTHDCILQVGYGLEGVLPDFVCNEIIQQEIIPLLKQDNLYDAIEATIRSVNRIISDPKAAAEIAGTAKLKMDAEQEELLELFRWFICAVVFLSFIYTITVYIGACRSSRRARGNNYTRAICWRSRLIKLLVGAIISCGAGLIFYLLALWRYKYWRTRRVICDTCGTKMHRLSEEEDNKYLTSTQDCEERLGSTDYDVWLCPKCGTIERFPFRPLHGNKYTECPACHAMAFAQKYDRMVRRPTSRTPGLGQKIYVCEHCGHTEHKDYNIPPSDNGGGTGAFIAGAALGALASSSHNGGFGGDFSGGSFGGGSFGGGGAAGKW